MVEELVQRAGPLGEEHEWQPLAAAQGAALHRASSRRPGRGQHLRQIEGRGRADIRFEDGLH